jgi:phosphoglycerate dehydrogenase-like enzyme
MKITDIRVINADQPRCQVPLVEVEADTGLIGIGAHCRHRVAVTTATEGMIDAAFIEEMKSSAYLIDCSGRSVLFDYPALVAAITGQTIAGALLQPGGASAELRCPPAGDLFWERPNIIVTPCRGTSVQANDKARNLILDNFRRIDTGEPLLRLVDKVAGY